MTPPLYRWPPAAKFDRTVPKAKFYEHGTIGPAIKAAMVSDVRRITWAYKLAESTINLPSSAEVPEIQVFEIDCKGEDVTEQVLAAIDRAVRTPIIFEIGRGVGADGAARMVAAHKQVDTGTPKLGPYFSTDWRPVTDDRVPLPTAIDLTSMYTSLLEPLTPITSRPGEALSDVIGRLTKARALEREIAALNRKLRNERQLNRKIELRRQLLDRQAALAALV
ncbi:DUF4391 domain-containing protein [Dietzia maris]|uniref:DUF4391 domain-containing protein n=1 Tax=Dietzia maris TaxID=37915 RepID=UPI0037CAD0F7